jgi:hypothetical protein
MLLPLSSSSAEDMLKKCRFPRSSDLIRLICRNEELFSFMGVKGNLLCDMGLLLALDDSRLDRKKHSGSSLPKHACLEFADMC